MMAEIYLSCSTHMGYRHSLDTNPRMTRVPADNSQSLDWEPNLSRRCKAAAVGWVFGKGSEKNPPIWDSLFKEYPGK